MRKQIYDLMGLPTFPSDVMTSGEYCELPRFWPKASPRSDLCLRCLFFSDPEERIIRECDDTDNEGVFAIQEEEAPKIAAADLCGAFISKKHYRKLLISSAVLLSVSWLGNLGLIFLASVLTQKVDTQSGDLTDVSGEILAIKAKGDTAKFTRRQEGDVIERDVRDRHLRGGGPGWVRVGTLDKTKSEVEELWADYESAVPITGTYEIEGTQYTDAVKPGTHIHEQGLSICLYK